MTPDWSVAEVQEFVPQGFDTAHMVRLHLPSENANKNRKINKLPQPMQFTLLPF